MYAIHTDMASEAKEIWENSSKENTRLDGVISEEHEKDGCIITSVKIISDAGENELCKPKGKYITFEPRSLFHHRSGSIADSANMLSSILRDFLSNIPHERCLFCGIGNRAVTPDSFGPHLSDKIIATAHLKSAFPDEFSAFTSVFVISPGVLGTTGVECADMISSVSEKINADCVIAADALFSASTKRLCRTVQITDTGIVPGSGVGNSRYEISERTLGIPVISIGVPTVTDLYSAASEVYNAPNDIGERGNIVVTLRDIDSRIKDITMLTAYGVNMALHKGLTTEDIDMLI